MPSLRSLLPLSLGVFVFGFGCVEPDESVQTPSDEAVGEAKSQIKGGYEDSADTAVVGIYNFDHYALCSGSLIAPNVVLTARHCVGNLYNDFNGGVYCPETTFGASWNAQGFVVTPVMNIDSAQAADLYYVQEVLTAPGTSDLFCGNDLAILILKKNIPAEVAVPLTPRVDSMLAMNEEYYAVGYGTTSDGGPDQSGIRRRRDNLFVDCAETDCKGLQGELKYSEWLGDTGICSGDSGGPAVDMQNRVTGVTSRGGQDCTFPIYGAVHAWGDWLMEVGRYGAELGGYPAPLWATGFPTDPPYNQPVGGDCEENGCSICWDGECTRLCNDSNAPCPDGYNCEEVQQGTSVCVEPPPPPPADDDGGDGGDGATDGGDDDGCSVGGAGADPTNPVPWLIGVGAFLGLMPRLRRSRASKKR